MTLKTASRIEWTIRLIVSIIEFPFMLVVFICKAIKWLIDTAVDTPCAKLCHWVGNKLLLGSDEVKDGTICNKDALKRNAITVYAMWKEEQKSGNSPK